MKRTLKVTVLVIALSATNLALADVLAGSASNSGSTSGSTSTSNSQGAGTSVNTIGTNSNSISGANSGSTSSSIGGGASKSTSSGGNSTVNVSVSIPGTGSPTGTPSTLSATPSAVGDAGSSANNTKATVEYGGTYTVKNAPAVAAPSLTTTLSDTCMGSVSFGLSLTGFGASAASTMVDQACVRRLDSREFRAMGLNDVALALLCQSDANRKAVESTGHDCPGTTRPAVAAASPTIQQESVPVGSTALVSSIRTPEKTEVRDPYVRRRLGLEPLTEDAISK